MVDILFLSLSSVSVSVSNKLLVQPPPLGLFYIYFLRIFVIDSIILMFLQKKMKKVFVCMCVRVCMCGVCVCVLALLRCVCILVCLLCYIVSFMLPSSARSTDRTPLQSPYQEATFAHCVHRGKTREQRRERSGAESAGEGGSGTSLLLYASRDGRGRQPSSNRQRHCFSLFV